MPNNQLSKGIVQAYRFVATGGGIKLGSKTLGGVLSGVVSVNPPSILATSRASVSVTIAGVKAGDLVVMEPPATLNDDLIYCGCEAGAGVVYVNIYNPTGGAVDDTAKDWNYRIIQVS
jgi:hypothetical protein